MEKWMENYYKKQTYQDPPIEKRIFDTYKDPDPEAAIHAYLSKGNKMR